MSALRCDPSVLTCVIYDDKVTPVTKTQIYLPDEELRALHRKAAETGRSVADLVREAIRRVWLRPIGTGPIALWDGQPKRASADHDSVYDLDEARGSRG